MENKSKEKETAEIVRDILNNIRQMNICCKEIEVFWETNSVNQDMHDSLSVDVLTPKVKIIF
jgi:hypothetical protein